MLQLKNPTPFKASVIVLPDADGVDTLFTVVKGTFAIGQQLTLAGEQLPVVVADQHHGDPAASSVRVPSDISLVKPSTDVVVLGSAWAPNGRPAWSADVSITVGAHHKALRVFGDRVWNAGAAGASITPVAPFVSMPLVWERAFGGTVETKKGLSADARNPVGVGYRASGGVTVVDGAPLPNIEDPFRLITSPKDAPAPAGFAPVAPHWQPRSSFAGTYDESWQQERAPYLPKDFDPRFFQIASTGLSVPPLQGGEHVNLRGITPDGVLQFQLPPVRVVTVHQLGAMRSPVQAMLDTVIIEPDLRRLVLIWRTAFRCDKKVLQVKEVETALLPAA